MQTNIDLIINNPVYLIVALLIIVLLLMGIIRRLMVLTIVALLLCAGYLYWVQTETGASWQQQGAVLIEGVKHNATTAVEHGKEAIGKLKQQP